MPTGTFVAQQRLMRLQIQEPQQPQRWVQVLLIDADASLHRVLTQQCMLACSCPQAAPVATNSVQQIREARLQPLKIALQDAIALHTKATGVREALEAEVRCPRRGHGRLGTQQLQGVPSSWSIPGPLGPPSMQPPKTRRRMQLPMRSPRTGFHEHTDHHMTTSSPGHPPSCTVLLLLPLLLCLAAGVCPV